MNRFIFIVLFLFAVPAFADPAQPLKFENVVGANTFTASGKLIQLWGIKPPDPQSAYNYAARMYLASILSDRPIVCTPASGELAMRCKTDGIDIAGKLVSMGVVTASEPAYKDQEDFAKRHKYGMWKP